MVHTFKFGGQRIAYDNISGLVLPLSELAFKMLDYIELPMASECSSALRYDLAKYDSKAIGETYNMLYSLYRDGKLFADGDGVSTDAVLHGAAIMLGDTICTRECMNLSDKIDELLEKKQSVSLSVIRAPENTVPFTGADVPTLSRELEKIAKQQVKRERADANDTYKVFSAIESKPHSDERCLECWACKLCSLDEPHNAVCDLERKRIECVMLCSAADRK